MTVSEVERARIFEQVMMPSEDTINNILDVFLTPGKIPEESELMSSISKPKLFPYNEKGGPYVCP